MQQSNLKPQKGQIIIIAIVFFAILLGMSATLMGYISLYVKSGRQEVSRSQALHLAEAGIDKAMYQLNQNGGYSGESNTSLGNGTFTISVTDIDSATKKITATGYIPNATAPIATRTVSVHASLSSHVIAFHYGVQTGNGGFFMSGSGTTINGSVYANGNIQAQVITGSAVAANLPTATADQANDSPTTPPNSVIFANASATEDFAQSFQMSQSYSFNNIKFYIKKTGNPSNATVRILYDNNGAPGSAVSGLTGTLTASQVIASYGWVTVTLPTAPILTAGETYWLVIDASSNSSNYYTLAANANGYANGVGKIGKNGGTWNNTTPSGLDGYFQLYLGGQTSSISGGTIGTTSSDVAWAHTINNANVTGPIYCQTGSGNNSSCITSRADPDPQPMPLSDGNIQDWKDEALAGEPIEGDVNISSDTTLGPTKINGNVSITGGKILTVAGTIWITGTLKLTGGSAIQLAASYGPNDGVIITDSYVSLSGNSQFYGSGYPHSYPFLITTSSCPDDDYCSNNNAIGFGGGSGTVGLVAQNGTINISGGSALKAVTAKTLSMTGGSELIYDSGLVSAAFSSGPGGSWTFLAGTYVIVK